MHASSEPPQREGQDHAEAGGAVGGRDGARGCVGRVPGRHARGVPHHRPQAVAERARPVREAGHPQGRHSPRGEEGDACGGERHYGMRFYRRFFAHVNSSGGPGATVAEEAYVRMGSGSWHVFRWRP